MTLRPLTAAALVCSITLVIATGSFAQATQPTTAPADTTTPKGTLKLLSEAMEQGDVNAMRDLMIADEPVEKKMVAAQIAQAEAFAQFRKALVATFGQQALEELTGKAPTAAERNAVFDAAPEKLEGDRATVTVEQDAYELRKIGGRWMLSLASMAKSVEPAMLDESLKEMTVRSDVMREIAAEITQGKYQTTDEVGQAVQGKLMVAMMREAAATQPATQRN